MVGATSGRDRAVAPTEKRPPTRDKSEIPFHECAKLVEK